MVNGSAKSWRLIQRPFVGEGEIQCRTCFRWYGLGGSFDGKRGKPPRGHTFGCIYQFQTMRIADLGKADVIRDGHRACFCTMPTERRKELPVRKLDFSSYCGSVYIVERGSNMGAGDVKIASHKNVEHGTIEHGKILFNVLRSQFYILRSCKTVSLRSIFLDKSTPSK